MNTTFTADEFLAALPAAIALNARDATPAQVVDAIRRDLKLAVKTGLVPSHAKFSVTRRDYKSISVELVAFNGGVLVDGYIAVCIEAFVADKASPSSDAADPFMSRLGRTSRRQSQDGRLTDALNEMMWLVERIADRHNYDNSQIETDYFDIGYSARLGSSRDRTRDARYPYSKRSGSWVAA